MFWIEFDECLIAVNSFFCFANVIKSNSKVIVSISVLRVYFDGFLKVRDGFIRCSHGIQCASDVAVCFRIIWINFKSFSIGFYGFLVSFGSEVVDSLIQKLLFWFQLCFFGNYWNIDLLLFVFCICLIWLNRVILLLIA